MKRIEQEVNESYGTILVNTMDELSKILDAFDHQMISPGGAAQFLGVSRAYIHQLEKEKKIRAYRILDEHIKWDSLPSWARLLAVKRAAYIYIPMEDLKEVKREMIEKAEARLKKLKSK